MIRKEYALYKGDEILCIGTVAEIALKQGVGMQTINFYKTPSYKRRVEKRKGSNDSMVLIEIEDDDCTQKEKAAQ